MPCYRLLTPSRYEPTPKPHVRRAVAQHVMCDSCLSREPLYQEWRTARGEWNRALRRLQRAWVSAEARRGSEPPSLDLPFDVSDATEHAAL